MTSRVLKPEYAMLAACTFILCFTLMVRPVTGVADNGDFGRIMGSVGLHYMTSDYNERYFGYVNRLYSISAGIPAGGGYFSTEIPLVILAVVVSQLVKNTWVFDIRYLSGIYSILFLISAFMITCAVRKKSALAGWLTAVLTVLVFTDTAYIAYFNSLYGEAASFVFLLLMTGSGLYLAFNRKPKLWVLILYFAGALFFTGAKLQNGPVGLLAALFGLRLMQFGKRKALARENGDSNENQALNIPEGAERGTPQNPAKLPEEAEWGTPQNPAKLPEEAEWGTPQNPAKLPEGAGVGLLWRTKAWSLAAFFSAAVVVLISLVIYSGVSKDIKVCNKYQSVFYGILKDSPDPAGDLRELGLDPALSVLAGTNYFMSEYPVDIRSDSFKAELYEKVSPFKVALFYLKHPDRLLGKLSIAAVNGFRLKQGVGNFEKYQGTLYRQTANYMTLWSDFKMYGLPHTLLFVSVFFAVFFIAAAVEYIKTRDASTRLIIELLAMIGVIGIAQMGVTVIGDGEADMSKHLFLFNLCFDIIFSAGLIRSAVFISKSARRI